MESLLTAVSLADIQSNQAVLEDSQLKQYSYRHYDIKMSCEDELRPCHSHPRFACGSHHIYCEAPQEGQKERHPKRVEA